MTARRAGLWTLVAGPAAWALHFLACYVTAAIWCAKAAPAAPLDGARTAILAYTAVALLVIFAFGWRGWRWHRMGDEAPPHDEPTTGDRTRFVGYATMLLCGLSFVAVVYVALPAVVIGTCRGPPRCRDASHWPPGSSSSAWPGWARCPRSPTTLSGPTC